MCSIIGSSVSTDDILVWEHRKRPSRLNIKPLIEVGNNLVWGPHSANRSARNWISYIKMGALPYDLESAEITQVIDNRKSSIEQHVVTTTAKIVSDFTEHFQIDAVLNKFGNHPRNLDDYDVIAYIPNTNTIFNVECKDILPTFTIKDDIRLRTKFFGDTDHKNRGFTGKVERRETYLVENWSRVLSDVFQISRLEKPVIVSLMVSRYTYWWTRFPSVKTDVKFISINRLRGYIGDIIKS